MKKAVMILALILSGTAFGQEAALTPSGAAKAVLAYSYRIKSRAASVDAAQASVRRADAMKLPSISYDLALTRGNDPVYVFGSLLRQHQFTMDDFSLDKLNTPDERVNFSNALTVQLPLFTGFKIRDYRKLDELALRQGEAARDFTAQAEMFGAVQNYLMLAFKTELAKIAAEAESSTRAELAMADQLRSKGFVLGSDYYAAQAALASISVAKTGFENDEQAESAALNVRMGRAPQTPVVAGAGFAAHFYAVPEEAVLLAGLDAQRGDINAARLQAQSAELARTMESNSTLPQIGAFAQMQTNTEDFSANPFNNMVGVSMTIPFGDFTRVPRMDEKAAQKAQAENEAKAMRDSAAAELVRYRRGYESAQKVLPQAQAVVSSAQHSLELFKPMFRQGRQSVLEVVRAEAALMSARAAAAETVFKLHSCYASVIFVSGKFDLAAASAIDAGLAGDAK